MRIKEIRLLDVDIFESDKKIFSGKIEDAYPLYGNCEAKEINFEDEKMCIII